MRNQPFFPGRISCFLAVGKKLPAWPCSSGRVRVRFVALSAFGFLLSCSAAVIFLSVPHVLSHFALLAQPFFLALLPLLCSNSATAF